MLLRLFCLMITSLVWGAGLVLGTERTLVMDRDFGNKPLPGYNNGVLYAYDSHRSIVQVFDAQGRVAIERKLSLPDAYKIVIRDVAASPSGTLAVACSVARLDGGPVSAIFWLSSSGEVIRVVRTSPFAPFRIRFTHDGNLWAVGRLHDQNFEDVPNHEILRQYDGEGRLTRAVLPTGTFAANSKKHPAFESFLRTAANKLGVYCVTASEWIEVSLAGDLLGRWRITPAPDITVAGVAMSRLGNVYVTAQARGEMHYRIYQLDKSRGELVSSESMPGTLQQGGVLLGGDSYGLVFYSQGTVSWSNLD